MSDMPESVVRSFIATWEHPSVDDLDRFFSEDATYADPRGVQSGLDAVRKLFEEDFQMVPSTVAEIRAIASNGGTVMVERVDTFPVGGREFTMDAVCVVDVRSDGRITRWREYYDQKSITDQIEAAGIPVPH